MRHKFETMTDLAEEIPLYGYMKPNATDIFNVKKSTQNKSFEWVEFHKNWAVKESSRELSIVFVFIVTRQDKECIALRM